MKLLEHFDRVSEAPGAVPRLRRFILDLAVRGRLVEQDPNEEPAVELLKRIHHQKRQLGKGKEQRLAALPGRDLPLPKGWEPASIQQILLELQTGPFGSSLHQTDYRRGGIPVVNPASIKGERILPLQGMAVGLETIDRLASFKLRSGDIVMARRGEMGRCAVVSEREAGWLCGTGSLILRPSGLMSARFLVMWIGSPPVRDYLSGAAVGTTMQNLNQSILLGIRIALPPAAEQFRIVAKVDELMAVCDRLEAQLKTVDETSCRALEAVLRDALADAGAPGAAVEQGTLA